MESRKLMENKFTEFDKNTNESDFFLKGGEMLFFNRLNNFNHHLDHLLFNYICFIVSV